MTIRRLIVLAVSVVLVVAALAVLAATRHPDARTPDRSTPETTTGTPIVPSLDPGRVPTADLLGNRLEVVGDDAGQALPQDPSLRPSPSLPDYLWMPPARLQWQRGWGGAALPVSGSDGPTRIDAGVASGFADTPQGAALAACDAIARVLAAPEGVWQTVIRQRYLGAGPAFEDRIARSRRNTPDAARYVTVPDGIRIMPYRPDFAVVEIAVPADQGWVYSTWPMAYTDGDWHVRVPDDIDTLWEPGVPMTSLTGFGSWKDTP
ncbi:hypothetical protein [Nocardia terpenica]|uniref:DUF8175 domain-containing protein n=1 Tax=Nocardia terpenica TaxID=455432 RepID=A0A164JHR8_9NOCA|nr:hypothetical protein [Nocardia terpenica]KZM70415.1 hypothetical protein AWN90_03795 [Nocardia terpenica]NQE91096.1 hypothetical protein [Nocardia terpenica]